MKICLINNLYKPWERGGAEKIVLAEAKGLSAKGHDVFVIATAPEETKSGDVYFLRSVFYNFGSYPLWRRLFWHVAGLFPSKRIKRIWGILKKEKPDLVITHNLVGVGLYLPKLLKKKGLRHFHVLHDVQLMHPSGLIISGHESMMDSWPARLYQFFTKRLFDSPQVVISPSLWLLEEHKRRGFFPLSKKAVIPNHFPSLATGKNFDIAAGKKFRFLFVGQIESHKGVDFLLEAWKSFIASSKTEAELVFVGDGSLLTELKTKADDKVFFVGKKNAEEVRDLMLGADLLIVPSLCYENSPTVIYEAAAAGLPVLAADLGGIGELVKKVGGRLFSPGDVSGLAEKMAELAIASDKLREISEKELAFVPIDHVSELEALAKSGDKV
jgi:glycosyltransferase involved in cell wall biosynthesis